MALIALVCASLLGLADAPSPATDVAAEYQRIKANSGRTPDDQVRLALWCEAHGLTAERMRHLTLAVLADPTNATARGLAGLVARNGSWIAPDTVAQTVRTDAATAARLADYDLKRSQTPYTTSAQLALATWADHHGLKDQARAHYTAVTRLDPHREVAWHRLGYKKRGGIWETEAQIQAARTEAEAQKKADQLWSPILQKCKTMLAHPADRAEAQATLAQVTDSRAFHAIRMVFGHGSDADQGVAVQLLGQIGGGPATLALANLAVHGHKPTIREEALEALSRHDPRDCLDALVNQIRTPWNYEVKPITGPGSVGGIFVEGERFNLERLYAPPVGPNLPTRGASLSTLKRFDTSTPRGLQNTINAEIAAENLRLARQALSEDLREVENTNAKIIETNTRVRAVLTRITGQDLGGDPQGWARWNTERVGFAYRTAATSAEKPTFTVMPDLAYQNPVAFPSVHTACFAANTPVRTLDGTKRIELVQPGDLVLVQDTASGALSFQPVLTAFHNPPSATYRVILNGEAIVATGIHRFWQAGKGWVMARDLKVGDLLRTIGGVAAVEAVTPEKTQPVYNLEVAEGRSFFVGSVGALVHDNSLVEATPTPFDAVRPVAMATAAR